MNARRDRGVARLIQSLNKFLTKDRIIRSRVIQKMQSVRTRQELIYDQMGVIGSEAGMKFYDDKQVSRRTIPHTPTWYGRHAVLVLLGVVPSFLVMGGILGFAMQNFLIGFGIALFVNSLLWILLYTKTGLKEWVQVY